MNEDEPRIDQAIDTALDRTVEAQEAFIVEPNDSDEKPRKAAIVTRRAEDLEALTLEDVGQIKRRMGQGLDRRGP